MGRNTRREPRAELRQGADALHEWFVALVDAGFTEQTAMAMIVQVLAEQMKMVTPPPEE